MFAMSSGIISIERTKNHGHTRRTDETATDLLKIAKKAHLRHELNLSSLNADEKLNFEYFRLHSKFVIFDQRAWFIFYPAGAKPLSMALASEY